MRDSKFQGLKQEDAQFRSERIQNVQYKLSLHVLSQEDYFRGKVEIKFECTKNDAPLSLDFKNGKIHSLILNEKTISSDHNQTWCSLPKEKLQTGENIVVIEYEQNYSKNGSGFYKFIDPQDQRTYHYSDFEPMEANYLFPCFDQPDLKATYTLDVICNSDCKVLTSTMETKVETLPSGEAHWFFPQSKKFSTYIFSVHVGPYYEWTDPSHKIPLRLYARHSLKDFVRVEEWFLVTKQGFDFFEDYFDVPYPYEKYDQILCPDFNMGAMENVAAVTFTENFIQRSEPTRKQRATLAEVILHEMAHMWFGNLVTMKWWNGLWLNESFATYMAFLAQYKNTEFSEAWENLFRGKIWGYEDDKKVTTHPIEVPVPDTASAFVNFDGITYEKGAASLKQLSFLLGEIPFRDGVRHYLKKFSEKNTEIDDFFGSLGLVAQKDLTAWVKQWIYSASLNSVQFKSNSQEKGALLQSAPEKYPTLREHKTKLAFFKKIGGTKYKLLDEVEVQYQGEETTFQLPPLGMSYDFVFPNFEDHDFVRVKLDQKSREELQSFMKQREHPFLRNMLWYTLWDMVEDESLSLREYVELALDTLPSETDLPSAQSILLGVRHSLHFLSLRPELEKDFTETQSKFESVLWRRFETDPAESDFKKLWFDELMESAKSKKVLDALSASLSSDRTLFGFLIDQDRAWRALRLLSSQNYPKVREQIEKEKNKDPGDRGTRYAYACLASAPEHSQKEQWIKDCLDSKSKYTLSEQRTIFSTLFSNYQFHTMKRFSEFLVEFIKTLPGNRSQEFLKSFTNWLIPNFADQKSIQELEGLLQSMKDMHPVLRKSVMVEIQKAKLWDSILSNYS